MPADSLNADQTALVVSRSRLAQTKGRRFHAKVTFVSHLMAADAVFRMGTDDTHADRIMRSTLLAVADLSGEKLDSPEWIEAVKFVKTMRADVVVMEDDDGL